MNPRQWEYLGVDEIRRKHGVAPSQLTDLWALMGDVSVRF
jgi:5'-3' exonuclease